MASISPTYRQGPTTPTTTPTHPATRFQRLRSVSSPFTSRNKEKNEEKKGGSKSTTRDEDLLELTDAFFNVTGDSTGQDSVLGSVQDSPIFDSYDSSARKISRSNTRANAEGVDDFGRSLDGNVPSMMNNRRRVGHQSLGGAGVLHERTTTSGFHSHMGHPTSASVTLPSFPNWTSSSPVPVPQRRPRGGSEVVDREKRKASFFSRRRSEYDEAIEAEEESVEFKLARPPGRSKPQQSQLESSDTKSSDERNDVHQAQSSPKTGFFRQQIHHYASQSLSSPFSGLSKAKEESNKGVVHRAISISGPIGPTTKATPEQLMENLDRLSRAEAPRKGSVPSSPIPAGFSTSTLYDPRPPKTPPPPSLAQGTNVVLIRATTPNNQSTFTASPESSQIAAFPTALSPPRRTPVSKSPRIPPLVWPPRSGGVSPTTGRSPQMPFSAGFSGEVIVEGLASVSRTPPLPMFPSRGSWEDVGSIEMLRKHTSSPSPPRPQQELLSSSSEGDVFGDSITAPFSPRSGSSPYRTEMTARSNDSVLAIADQHRSSPAVDSTDSDEDSDDEYDENVIIGQVKPQQFRKGSVIGSRPSIDMPKRPAYQVEVVCNRADLDQGEDMRWEVVVRKVNSDSTSQPPTNNAPIQVSDSPVTIAVPFSASSLNLSLSLDQAEGRLVFVTLPSFGDTQHTPTRRRPSVSGHSPSPSPSAGSTFGRHPHRISDAAIDPLPTSPRHRNQFPRKLRPTSPTASALPGSPLTSGFPPTPTTPPISPREVLNSRRKASLHDGVLYQ